jgi:hypothetical protein
MSGLSLKQIQCEGVDRIHLALDSIQSPGSYEYDNKPLGSTKGKGFLHWMRNHQHIIMLCVTSSLLTNLMKYSTKTCCIQTFVLAHVLMMLRAMNNVVLIWQVSCSCHLNRYALQIQVSSSCSLLGCDATQ